MNTEALATALNKIANAVAELAEALTPADAPAPEAAKPTKPAKPATKPEPTIDYTEIAAAIGKLVTTKGRPRAVEVLAGFGAANGKELKPEQYAKFLSAVGKETADA